MRLENPINMLKYLKMVSTLRWIRTIDGFSLSSQTRMGSSLALKSESRFYILLPKTSTSIHSFGYLVFQRTSHPITIKATVTSKTWFLFYVSVWGISLGCLDEAQPREQRSCFNPRYHQSCGTCPATAPGAISILWQYYTS